MNKQIPISKDKRIETLVKLISSELPPSELQALKAIIKYSTDNSLFIDTNTAIQIKKETGLSGSGFSTALFRLAEKQLIRRIGKNVILNGAFKDIDKLEKLVINFL